MSRNANRIDVSRTNGAINGVLSGSGTRIAVDSNAISCNYNQNEDQFLLLGAPIDVPSLPIHHTLENPEPPQGYVEIIEGICGEIMRQCPALLAGTRWYFDPSSILTPTFYRVEERAGVAYLYHVILDLTCRPLESTITVEGSNTMTHAYRGDRLYFECDYFPVSRHDGNTVTLKQTIPITWKGEAGQGYMIHGLWMDSDINKFFSKLILPAGKRNHPYYPITCKQHCVSMNAWGQSGPDLLHRITSFIEPELIRILEDLQATPFSELMPLFEQIKKTIPAELGERWKNLEVRSFLNARDQKEYTVEF
ncbi:MAG TPA: hypothetical protein PKO22_06470 [Treponemataceae bacterium]|nr:hypothetical protein [Treponemataceae bacterium]